MIFLYFDKIFKIQKQPPGGVPRKKCSENMQQIYRGTTMPKCDFNKSHFGMDVLLQICCIFSEHLFLRTPLDGCFWYFLNIFAEKPHHRCLTRLTPAHCLLEIIKLSFSVCCVSKRFIILAIYMKLHQVNLKDAFKFIWIEGHHLIFFS